jgi:hypothetical protein
MTDMTPQLSQTLSVDEAPMDGLAFRYAVMARIEQRLFWKATLGLSSTALLIGTLVWAIAPTLEQLARRMHPASLLIVALVTFGVLMMESAQVEE